MSVLTCGVLFCFVPQRAAQQGGEALSVWLGVLGGEAQAQLDGFKSRALRGVVHQAQRHLYATEWGTLEAASTAAGTPALLEAFAPAVREAAAAASVVAAAPGALSLEAVLELARRTAGGA
eukprot:2128783-Prymnesium_polylepis.2